MKHIILVNYGGPESTSHIEDYLFRLFSDKNVIQLPGGKIYQRLFAQIMSMIRAKKLKSKYEIIGGSPLFSITQSLINKLNQKGKHRYYQAMAFSSPFIPDVLESISEEKVFIFPLFPHFSPTTTGACLSSAKKNTKKKIFYLKEYWQDPDFNSLIVKRIKEIVCGIEKAAVLFSAHSIPVKYAKRGDPYLESIYNHFKLLQNLLPGHSLFLGLQSKLGPLKWAGPELKEVIQNIKTQGFNNLILYPLSFVIDNFETAYEIDVFYRDDIIHKLNLSFSRIPCLNNSKDFISYIEKKVEKDQWLELA